MRTLVYDNKGKTCDRYTVYIPNGYCGWDRFTMSETLSVNQYMDTVSAFNETDARIFLKDLPKQVRRAIRERKRK